MTGGRTGTSTIPGHAMPRLFLIIGAGLLVFALQFAVIPLLIADPFKPDLILVMVVCLGLRAAGWWVVPLSWLLGTLQDSFAGIYPGLNGFAFLAIALILRQTAEHLYATRLNVLLSATAGATLLHGMVHGLFLSLFSVAPGVWGTIVTNLPPQLLANLFAASLVPLFTGFGEEPME